MKPLLLKASETLSAETCLSCGNYSFLQGIVPYPVPTFPEYPVQIGFIMVENCGQCVQIPVIGKMVIDISDNIPDDVMTGPEAIQ